MKRYLALLLAMILLAPLSAAQARKMLTISLPETVLSEAISAALPLDYVATSKTLKGTLRIIDLSELQLGDQQLSCRMHLAGQQLQIVTELGGQSIRLNVGDIELDFQTNASLRFDQSRQTLFITPQIEKVNSAKDAGGGDLGNALIQLLHGNEFPVKIDDLEPFVTRAGARTLTVTTRIADIRSQKEWLQIFLDPQIGAN